jgi:hypothetical protein
MFLMKKSKRLLAGVIVAVLALGGVAAFAYWTSSGEGTSTVTASAGGAGFEITGAAEGISPGGTVEGKIKVKNKDIKQPEYLTKLVTTVKETGAVGCEKTWFEITAGGEQEPKVELAAGETKEYTVSLKMKDEAVNQDACKGAVISLKAAAS